jgi:hypothetical protein
MVIQEFEDFKFSILKRIPIEFDELIEQNETHFFKNHKRKNIKLIYKIIDFFKKVIKL